MTLQHNTLPNGRPISLLGLGCSSIWAKPSFAERSAETIFNTAIEHGINYFDTSPSYGIAEQRLSWLLATQTRSNIVISTKVGTIKLPSGKLAKDFSPEGMEATLTASLAMLGLEYVDILYLHGGRSEQLTSEVYRFFEMEKARGRIIYSGLNSFEADVIKASTASPIDVVMLQYNVADLSAAGLLDGLKSAGKTIIGATPLAQGITNPSTFVPSSKSRVWYLLRSLRKDPLFLVRGAKIRRVLKQYGLDQHADPIRFVTSDPRFTSAVFGTSRAEHVITSADAATQPITREDLRLLASHLGSADFHF